MIRLSMAKKAPRMAPSRRNLSLGWGYWTGRLIQAVLSDCKWPKGRTRSTSFRMSGTRHKDGVIRHPLRGTRGARAHRPHRPRVVAQVYKREYPQCLVWEFSLGEGLWRAYPTAVQRELCAALQNGQDRLLLGATYFDFETLRHEHGASRAVPVRSRIRTMFRHQNGGQWSVTSDLQDFHEWKDAAVLMAGGGLAVAVGAQVRGAPWEAGCSTAGGAIEPPQTGGSGKGLN